MFRLSGQCVRGVVYGLMLLLTAGVGPACMLDTDGSDETSAVSIELNAALPSDRLHLPQSQASGWNISSSSGPRKLATRPSSPFVNGHDTVSLPLVVPLRT